MCMCTVLVYFNRALSVLRGPEISPDHSSVNDIVDSGRNNNSNNFSLSAF